MSMLEAINTRLGVFARTMEKGPMRKVPTAKAAANKKYETPPEGSGKTIGIVAPAQLYGRLRALQEKLGARTIKEAAIRAIEAGLGAFGV